MTTPQFTPQKSYRDLVEGEHLRKGDINRDTSRLVGPNSEGNRVYLEDSFKRPIHRQPDGSWRDEGEETKKIGIKDLEAIASKYGPSDYDIILYALKELAELCGLPLEPEQEEWEKAFEKSFAREYFGDDEDYKRGRNVFRAAWQAHERKQGEKK